ncbi:beta strand repeat-containing protein, partial [Sediminibacterium sp.]|uniref:beta strand repeat-containing protein n=1 Tax=Sediminibacterium sp. TaxID=1917865 RepID=UPI003F71AD49
MTKYFLKLIVFLFLITGLTPVFAQPTITSFSPISAKPGDVVTITGTNFNTAPANNIVFFGATKATVTAATSTSLTVAVPSGATYAPITVLNTGTSLAAYSLRNFTPIYSPAKTNITAADFQAKFDFSTESTPISVAIGDLDGDGKPDLAVANYNSNTVSVLRNTSTSGSISSASFADKVDFSTRTGPISVAIGDLDGDGKPDLAVSNGSSNNVSVFRNTATSGSINTSSFAAKVDFTTGTNPQSIAIGDLDGDGKPDLTVANWSSNTFSIFRNTATSGSISTSSFAAKVDFTTGTNPQSVAIGDLDGDGKPDLAVANGGSNSVSVFRNTATIGSIVSGSFSAKVDLTTGANPRSIAIGDLDGDGKSDLAIAIQSSNAVSVFRNTATSGSIGSGSFAASVFFQATNGPFSIAIGDLDADGKSDLLFSNSGTSTVSVLRNTATSGSIGSGSFAAKIDFTTGTNPYSVAIGDLDGDGKPDLAVSNGSSNTLSILRNADIQLPPTITSFTSTTGPVGTLVTITGTNLNNPTAITIGGVAAIPISNTGTSLVAMVMPGATTGAVSVTTGSGTANGTGNFTVTASRIPNGQQGAKLVGTGAVGAAGQGFSVSLSADGKTAIVGGFTDNSNAGAAWVYTRSGGVWTQQGGKLVGTGAVGGAFQGYSVSLSADGNTAMVGGWGDNSATGAVWVYTRSGGVWTQQGGKLVGTGSVGASRQGISVSLSADGNTALVGGQSDNSSVGAAWVYTRSGGVWSQQGSKLVGTGGVGAAQQGWSVSLSADGNTAMVGGRNDNSNAGAAWVFTRSGGVWTQQGAKLVGTGAVGAARQGSSVSLSADGNTAIVGGFADNSDAGAAWVYTRSGGVWTQQGAKLVGTGAVGSAQQGFSVSLSADGNTAMVAGFLDNSNAGAAWVYSRSGGVWTQQGSKLVGTGAVGAAYQGNRVSLSADGNTAMVGGNADNSNAGAAWVYSYVPTPTITSATYNANTGVLSVTGTNFVSNAGATNDIDLSKLSLTGEGGSSYTLTTSPNVEITDATSFSITLNSTDIAAVNQILNKNGTTSTGATTFNLAAAADWMAGSLGNADLTGNPITVSNVAVPTISSATFNISTGSLVVTGANLLKLSGATNDIDVTKFTITGQGGATFTLTNNTTNVEITDATSFTVSLGATDRASLISLLNKNGTSSVGATTYNLAAAEDWNAGADAAVVIADLTGNIITVSNVATITTTGTLAALTTTYGTASNSTSFNISGASLTNDIIVTAPTGFEVSLSSTTGFANTVNLTQTAGIVPSTTIYVRLKLSNTVAASPYNGNVVCTSTNAATVNVATASSTVTVTPLTITATNVNKAYGSTLTGAAGSTAFTSTGLLNNETIGSVTIAYGTGAAPTAAIGTYTGSVTPSAATGGTFDANNYTITYTAGNIIVGKANLTITATNVNKPYGSTLTGAAGSTAFTSTGLLNNETIGSVT